MPTGCRCQVWTAWPVHLELCPASPPRPAFAELCFAQLKLLNFHRAQVPGEPKTFLH